MVLDEVGHLLTHEVHYFVRCSFFILLIGVMKIKFKPTLGVF